MFSTSMFGRGGPHSSQPGLGPVLTSLAGFTHLTGWPDRAPVSPYGAYTDFFLPHFAISGIIAALDYREETGIGQHLDMSQLEGAIHLLTPTLLEYSINGHIPMRSGNNNPNASPHGVFPCKDNDTWCALACLTETQWNSLANLTGKPALKDNPNFRTLRGRKENADANNHKSRIFTLNSSKLMRLCSTNRRRFGNWKLRLKGRSWISPG